MTAPKTWTPPPEMPANLPPLPVGRNSKKLVYVGTNEECNGNCWHTWGGYDSWVYPGYKHWIGEYKSHYAAESDSEICRLNQWGDFTPEAKPAEPAKPQTVLDVYRADVAAKLAEAAKTIQELRQSLAEWENYHGQLIEASTQLEVGDALSRKAWFEAGKRCERQHGKTPTNFPKYP